MRKITPAKDIKKEDVMEENFSQTFVADKVIVSMRLDTHLVDKIKNIVETNSNSGDGSLPSFSEFIRLALKAHKDGMEPMSLPDKNGCAKKRVVSVSMDREEKKIWDAWTPMVKGKMMERVLVSFIKNKL